MSEQQQAKSYWLIAGLLAAIVVVAVIALVLVNSEAAPIATSANITDAAPAVDSTFISTSANGAADNYTGNPTSITLAADTTTALYINGVVSDDNGASTITTVSSKFFASTTNNTCGADTDDCYIDVDCTISSVSGTTASYSCPITLQYFADETITSGDWTAEVTVTDGTTPIASTKSYDIGKTVAAEFPGPLAFGTLALGAATTHSGDAAAPTQVIRNQGNVVLDYDITGDNMDCTTGTIGTNAQKHGISDGDNSYASLATAMPGNAATVTIDANIPTQDSTGGITASVTRAYGIQLDATGQGGTCSSTLTMTAGESV